jgi:RNA polymerase sigma-70 factor (ECF subfamily)
MAEQVDEELIRQSLEGNREAFGRLVDRYQKTVYNIALRMVHERVDAEDVSQLAFVRAFQKLTTFNPKYKFFSWLYRITVNEALNFLKQKRQFEPIDDESQGEEAEGSRLGESEEEEQREQKIQDSLMELRVDHRAVVVLKHLQGLSYAEIAQILEIPEKTVKSRLFTARTILKNILLEKGLGKND